MTPDIAIAMKQFEPVNGGSVLRSILDAGNQLLRELRKPDADSTQFGITRLRGTGPDVAFSSLVNQLNADLPLEPEFPFEGSDLVGGAVWPELPYKPVEADLFQDDDEPMTQAVAKLQWKAHADDLPMHTHLYSDRCIIVNEGRGFFHWTDESLADFTGKRVNTIAVRERDVLVFTRGLVHTFSTTEHPMQLLSCHMPYLPLDNPRQYSLPNKTWTFKTHGHLIQSQIVADTAWSCHTVRHNGPVIPEILQSRAVQI